MNQIAYTLPYIKIWYDISRHNLAQTSFQNQGI